MFRLHNFRTPLIRGKTSSLFWTVTLNAFIVHFDVDLFGKRTILTNVGGKKMNLWTSTVNVSARETAKEKKKSSSLEVTEIRWATAHRQKEKRTKIALKKNPAPLLNDTPSHSYACCHFFFSPPSVQVIWKWPSGSLVFFFLHLCLPDPF